MIVGSLELPITVTGASAAISAVRNVDQVAAQAANRGLKQLADAAEKGMDAASKGIGSLSASIRLLGEGTRGVDTRARSMAALENVENRIRASLASGNLTLERRILLERTLREAQQARASGSIGSILRDRVTGALGPVGTALGGLGLAFGGAALVSGIANTLGEAVAASGRFATSLRVLESTSRMTGVPLAFLQRTSDQLQKSLGTTATTTNTMVATAVRFTAAAGRANDTGMFMTRWLDLAKARGLSAAEAMQALETTLAGNDEGLNRLGLRNPGEIYKSWGAGADDASRKGAILNEVMREGEKVTGAWAAGMQTAEGQMERLRAAKENFLVALGRAITGSDGYTSSIDLMRGALEKATGWVNAHRSEISGLVDNLATLAERIGRVVYWLGLMSDAMNRLPNIRAANWVWGKIFGIDAAPDMSVGASVAADNPFAQRSSLGDPRGFGAVTAFNTRTPFQFGGPAVPSPRGGSGGRTGAGGRSGPVDPLAGLSAPDMTLGAGADSFGLGSVRNALNAPVGAATLATRFVAPVTTAMRALQQRTSRLANDVGETIADGIGAGFGAAFTRLFQGGGVMGAIGAGFRAMGGAMLSGLGSALVQFGQASLMASSLMQALKAALMGLAPGAGIAASIGIIALGTALQAAGSAFGGMGSGGGGGGGGGTFSAPGGGNSLAGIVLTPRAAPVGGMMAPTGRTGTPETLRPVNNYFSLMNPADPATQRLVKQAQSGADRRGIK